MQPRDGDLRPRLRRDLDKAAAESIAAALDSATKTIECS